MKVSDYIVTFLEEKKITDVFGYPGGMTVHFMDSMSKSKICKLHTNYNEQGAAFAACGYSQASDRIGVCYSTSGPGFTNLITGIANAFFDSIPLLILSFNVNTYESSRELPIKQKGFQEMDVTTLSKSFTKYCKYIENAEDIPQELEKAYKIATTGRPGPVHLDIPMDISRSDILPKIAIYDFCNSYDCKYLNKVKRVIQCSQRPCIIIGAGVKRINKEIINKLIIKLNIPVVSSMIASDLVSKETGLYHGFLGAYGNRTANFIVAKADCIISIGSRLDVRQISGNKQNFAPNACLIRFDIDEAELNYKIKDDELAIHDEIHGVINNLMRLEINNSFNEWVNVCNEIDSRLKYIDNSYANESMEKLSEIIQDDTIITADVGQNQVWVAQSFVVKPKQKVLYSGNFGSMGYSLPAAIGAYYGTKKPVISINGDGGIQMNIQELQFIAREHLPIKIIIFNNSSLGMIRHFQEMYMESNYTQTVRDGGYSSPEFEKIAAAYDLDYKCLTSIDEIKNSSLNFDLPEVIEVQLPERTYVYPKLAMQKPNQDQEPLLDRKLYNYIMSL